MVNYKIENKQVYKVLKNKLVKLNIKNLQKKYKYISLGFNDNAMKIHNNNNNNNNNKNNKNNRCLSHE